MFEEIIFIDWDSHIKYKNAPCRQSTIFPNVKSRCYL